MIAVAYLRKPLQTLLWSACVLALPVTAMAQPVSQLSGVVRDSTGSALPGVTVMITGAALGRSPNSRHQRARWGTRFTLRR